MHIAFVDTTLTTAPTGGAQTFLVDLVRSLVELRHRVSLVTQPGSEQRMLEALRRAGAELQIDLWNKTHLPEEKAARLAVWVNQNDVQVYVVSISPDAGWLALPLLEPSIATASIAHNDVWAFYEPVAHYAPLIDSAIGVSEEIARRLRNDCNMPPERVRYIPYGIQPVTNGEAERLIGEQGRPDTSLRIGYVGRVVQAQKRVMDFVAVALELSRRGVEFELHIIGDGCERERLEEEFKRNLLASRVTFWGWLEPKQVSERLASLDVFALLSDHEGLPVALLEGMGHALVPVVTRIASGNTQLIRDGENGFTFAVGDTSACAIHLEGLAGDGDLRRVMRRAAWMTSLDYSVELMTKSYEECFRNITDPGFSRDYRLSVPRPYPVLVSCVSRYPFWLRKVKSRVVAAAEAARARGNVGRAG
jgi:glycosyltransferase involved in cell wall biosynthesis